MGRAARSRQPRRRTEPGASSHVARPCSSYGSGRWTILSRATRWRELRIVSLPGLDACGVDRFRRDDGRIDARGFQG